MNLHNKTAKINFRAWQYPNNGADIGWATIIYNATLTMNRRVFLDTSYVQDICTTPGT